MSMKPHHPKRKALTRLLICIVVGLITSVGVAWVATVSVNISDYWLSTSTYCSTERYPAWEYTEAQGIVYVGIGSFVILEYDLVDEIKKGLGWSMVSLDPVLDNSLSTVNVLDEAWGWPMVCMSSRVKQDWSTGIDTVVFGIPLFFMEQRLLPTRPIWFNLLLNTSFYATITWLVLFGRVRLRNSIRRKLGLCIYCRYNILDLPVCPECGSEVVNK